MVTVAFAGCTNEEDLGGRSAGSDGAAPSGDGSSPGSDPDASTASDSGAKDSARTDFFGRTAAGESCNPAEYPPATTSCAIAGQYTVTESWCQGGVCGAAPPSADAYQWLANVTVTGTEVRLTNGTNRLLRCQLETACDCRSSSGDLTRFTSSGFVSLGKTACPGSPDAMLYSRDVGVKL
ncbi:MAG: hypothetical protein KF819_34755 [Labilithrix sp.]|nr:hypothetical protein [Labilithrix sp.]